MDAAGAAVFANSNLMRMATPANEKRTLHQSCYFFFIWRRADTGVCAPYEKSCRNNKQSTNSNNCSSSRQQIAVEEVKNANTLFRPVWKWLKMVVFVKFGCACATVCKNHSFMFLSTNHAFFQSSKFTTLHV